MWRPFPVPLHEQEVIPTKKGTVYLGLSNPLLLLGAQCSLQLCFFDLAPPDKNPKMYTTFPLGDIKNSDGRFSI